MKKLLFLCGPNGIGKTSISKKLVNMLPHSAYVDSDPCRIMNPFVLNDDTIPTISKNISDLISNYFNCPAVEIVIFSYGFHGRRKEVFARVIESISSFQYDFVPFLLWCGKEENIKRMNADSRSEDRIARALEESRKAFDEISYPKIDITHLSIEQAASAILAQANL